MNIKKIIFALLLLSSNVLKAQNTISLQECIDRGLNKSLQLKADSLDGLKIGYGIKQAYSSLYPNIAASGAYQYSPNVQESLLPNSFFGLPGNGYVAAKMQNAQVETVGISLNQLVYSASAFIGLKVAKVLREGNAIQIQSSKEDLIYNITATYYNLQALTKDEELTNITLAYTEQLLETIRKNLKAGIATVTDVDRLTVSRDNLKANVENFSNMKEKYYNLLKTLMNTPLSEKLFVEAYQQNESEKIDLQEPGYNPSNLSSYKLTQYNIKLAQLQRKNILAANKPSVSIGANYNYFGYYKSFQPFKEINDKFYPASTVALRLNVPIFDGFNARYQAKQKMIDIDKLKIQAEQITNKANQDVANAYADLKSNLITYQNQQRNLNLANKVLKDITLQYNSGLVRVTDVINAQSDLATSQNNFIKSLINIKQAQLNLKKATGSLLK